MVSIRRARPSDAETVSQLVDALLAELSGRPSQPEARLEAARRLLSMEGRVFGLLAEDGGRAVGVMMISESASIYAGGIFGVITELYVTPDYRSHRVARLLLEEASALGRQRGWPALEVGAPRQPQWHRSLQFYLGAGFTEIGPRLKLAL